MLSRLICGGLLRRSMCSGVQPPMKRHRDDLSVLRLLASTVKPEGPDQLDYVLIDDPWLSTHSRMPNILCKAKVAGRNAARMAMNDYFPQDILSLAVEVPRINALLPIVKGEEVIRQVDEAETTPADGIQMCIDLLAPVTGWQLYQKHAPSLDLDSKHTLLELLARSNSGQGGRSYLFGFKVVDRRSLPFPEELFYANEHRYLFQKQRENAKIEISSEEFPSAFVEDQPWDAKNSLAEQLFAAEPKTLRSKRAFSAMIRGAAQFGNWARALQLCEESQDLVSQFHQEVFHDMLACTGHGCSSAKELLQRVATVSELMAKAKLSAVPFTYEALSHGIFEYVQSHAKETDTHVLLEYLLGLIDDSSTMGFYANLFGSIRLALGFYDKAPKLLRKVLDELEELWAETPPCKTDLMSEDSLNFFREAMFMANLNRDLESALRLNRMIWMDRDGRFLLKDSESLSQFRKSFCRLIYRSGNLNNLDERTKVVMGSNRSLCDMEAILVLVAKVFDQNRRLTVVTNSLFETLVTILVKVLERIQKNTPEIEIPQERRSLISLDIMILLTDLFKEYLSFPQRRLELPQHFMVTIAAVNSNHLLASSDWERRITTPEEEAKLKQLCQLQQKSVEILFNAMQEMDLLKNRASVSMFGDRTRVKLANTNHYEQFVMFALLSHRCSLRFDSEKRKPGPSFFMERLQFVAMQKQLSLLPLLEAMLTMFSLESPTGELSQDFWSLVAMGKVVRLRKISSIRKLHPDELDQLRVRMQPIFEKIQEELAKMRSTPNLLDDPDQKQDYLDKTEAFQNIKSTLEMQQTDSSNRKLAQNM